MQCPSCRFENMPGMKKCVRCGGVLGSALADIDVRPPRASQRWSRRLDELQRQWTRLRSRLREGVRQIGVAGGSIPWWTVLWPGGPQWWLGRRRLSRILGIVSGVSLFLALLTWGSWFANLVLGVALAAHYSGAIDAVFGPGKGTRRGPELAAFLFVILGLVHYPLYRLSDSIAQPIVINFTVGEIHSGDVFLALRSSPQSQPPEPGEIIAFDASRDFMVAQNNRYQLRGFWIERVLARGPCRVVSDGQRLLVDGQEIPWKPLASPLPAQVDVTVPEHYILFAPLNLDRLRPGMAVGIPLSNQLLMIPETSVVGRVVWQTWPIWRWGHMK